MRDSAFCFWHDPEHEAERTEAQRFGRTRRGKEVTLAGAYEFSGLGTLDGAERLLEIAAFDTLALPNSVPRNRTLVSIALAELKAKEVGELAEQVRVLQQAVLGQQGDRMSPFDADLSPTPFIGDG